MFDLQLLYVRNDSYSVFSPWMDREADFVAMILSMDQFLGSPTLEMELFHKNSDEAGDGTVVPGGKITITASAFPGFLLWAGLKENVRCKFTVVGSAGSSGSDGDWCLMRTLDPVWYDAAS